MTTGEKGAWTDALVALAAYATYVTIVLARADGPLAQVSYVPTMLWVIGASVVLFVAARIVIAITKPSEADKFDVRDKEINRFGEYVGGIVTGIGMVVPLGLGMAEVDYFWIVNAIYLTFILQAVVSSAVKIRAYRRGF